MSIRWKNSRIFYQWKSFNWYFFGRIPLILKFYQKWKNLKIAKNIQKFQKNHKIGFNGGSGKKKKLALLKYKISLSPQKWD